MKINVEFVYSEWMVDITRIDPLLDMGEDRSDYYNPEK